MIMPKIPQRAPGGVRTVRKYKQKRVESVKYDRDAHREFVQGFRRRKEARRKIAKEQLRLEEKKKRKDLKGHHKDLREELVDMNERALKTFFGEEGTGGESSGSASGSDRAAESRGDGDQTVWSARAAESAGDVIVTTVTDAATARNPSEGRGRRGRAGPRPAASAGGRDLGR